MKLSKGDRIVLISNPSWRGEILVIRGELNPHTKLLIKWITSTFTETQSINWVYKSEVKLDPQVIRDNKLNELGI